MPARPPTLDQEILGLEPALAGAWSARFGDDSTLPAIVVHELLAAIVTGDPTELVDAARALGVLRAHEGRQVSALVEDMLALRTTMWGELSTQAAVLADPA